MTNLYFSLIHIFNKKVNPLNIINWYHCQCISFDELYLNKLITLYIINENYNKCLPEIMSRVEHPQVLMHPIVGKKLRQ